MVPDGSSGSGSASIAREISAVVAVAEKATETRTSKEATAPKAAEVATEAKVVVDKATAEKVATDRATTMRAAEEAVTKVAADAAATKTTNQGGCSDEDHSGIGGLRIHSCPGGEIQ
jgi:hypothetical protein